MKHRVAGRKLKRSSGHRRALYRNLITELFRHKRIKTTEAKARAVRAQAEKTITLAKRGDLHARRQAAAILTDPAVLKKLFEDLGPYYKDRPGGYTRIYRLGRRKGDGALMVLLELVE